MKSVLAAVAVIAAVLVASPCQPTAVAAVVRIEPMGDPEGHALGKVTLGDLVIEVIQEGNIEPGKEATFVLKYAGDTDPKKIRAWVGVESGKGSAKARAHKDDDGVDVHVEVPSPLPDGSKLYLELETPNGKVTASLAFKKA